MESSRLKHVQGYVLGPVDFLEWPAGGADKTLPQWEAWLESQEMQHMLVERDLRKT